MSALPFDNIAKDYDQEFTNSPIGQLQRQRVYLYLTKLLQNESIHNVLEFNCGTGEDACWLAERNCQVLATDNSTEMIEVAKEKTGRRFGEKPPSPLKGESLDPIIELTLNSDSTKVDDKLEGSSPFRGLGGFQQPDFQPIGLTEFSKLPNQIPFDLVFSNFGGLNCLDPNALQLWADNITKQLRPGGFVFAVILGRFCAWETFYFLLKRNWSAAWRRQSNDAIDAKLDNETTVPIWYFSPKKLSRIFQKNFTTINIRPIGSAIPPSYLDPFFQNKLATLSFLNKIENRFGHQKIWSNVSDHYLILLQKR